MDGRWFWFDIRKSKDRRKRMKGVRLNFLSSFFGEGGTGDRIICYLRLQSI